MAAATSPMAFTEPGPSGDAASDRARAFRTLALGFLVIGTSLLGLLIALAPETLRSRSFSLVCLWTAIPLLLLLNARGRTAAASWGLVLGLVALVTWRAYITGGLHTPLSPFYVVFVM